ncbi:hypothetical protein, partial [uncultured Methanobacterium sp.]|uniref:hypothetical protein n=1 Tax=uncultured Methanobacterium sp. TaxID=176306 RepID=UPI002AA6FB69
MNNQPYQSLMMLAIHINKKIINLISDNKIHGYDYSIIEGQKFQYNDVNGFNKFKTVTRDTKKVDWFEVMSFDNSIENSYEYNRALKNLSIFFGKDP